MKPSGAQKVWRGEEAGRLLAPLGRGAKAAQPPSLISCVVPSIGEQRQKHHYDPNSSQRMVSGVSQVERAQCSRDQGEAVCPGGGDSWLMVGTRQSREPFPVPAG